MNSLRVVRLGVFALLLGSLLHGAAAQHGLILQLNVAANLPVAGSATSFLFPNSFTPGQTYSVTIASQPASENCAITTNSGTVINADVSNVSVTCAVADNFTVGGIVQGGAAQFSGVVVLQNGQSYSASSPAVAVSLGALGELVCDAINASGTIAEPRQTRKERTGAICSPIWRRT